MKIFDFNIHLPKIVNNSTFYDTNTEIEANSDTMFDRFVANEKLSELDGANIMLFNSNCPDNNKSFIDNVRAKVGKRFTFTYLVDFRKSDVKERLIQHIKNGINCIKFHSYIQKIEESDYSQIVELCKIAERNNIPICLDASYGTVNMTKYDTLSFITTVAREVVKVPLIILHSGGIKCYEFLLLALDRTNVYFETSLTLNFFEGSITMENDLRYIYKKLGSEKLLYASDSPYVDFNDSLTLQQKFFSDIFPAKDLENIFYNNAIGLLNIE